ncbi:TrkH-domain-containing protein [Xylariaceae sp. FL0804]|nr:TrkH-domain-containing protein [Xylariaceae sp. FL0804]
MRNLRKYLPPLNFITIHYAYFILVSLVTSLVFWGSSNPRFSISYVDSLFLVVSAMTEAGLNTVNLSQMTTWQQILLWILIAIGSSIWVSIWTVLVRKHTFEVRFEEIVKKERERSLARRNTSMSLLPFNTRLRSFSRSRNMSMARPPPQGGPGASAPRGGGDGSSGGDVSLLPISAPTDRRLLSTLISPKPSQSQDAVSETAAQAPPMADDERRPSEPARAKDALTLDTDLKDTPAQTGATPSTDHVAFADELHPRAFSSSVAPKSAATRRQGQGAGKALKVPLTPAEHHHGLSAFRVGRNAQFHGLTTEDREKLGGTEYRALRLLSVAVPVYFFSWQLFGCIALGAWIANNQPQPARDNSISPWWNGIFNGVSAFNNSGMSVLDANMVPYGGSYFVLIVMGAMILAGNTAYPVFLRLSLWCSLKFLQLITYPHDHVEWKATLEYILKYPRRVYTNLFPSRQTWWLLFMLFVLNGSDWVMFEILNIGNPNLDKTPVGPRIIDGLFQALAVRSGGFYVVSISGLYIGLQLLYVIMMYISVYPVVITMRHSNVYEERSLGIYDNDVDNQDSGSDVSDHPLARVQANTGQRGMSFGRMLRHSFAEWHGVGAAPTNNRSNEESRISFISHQVRGQLSHDLWWLILAVLAIVIIETHHFLEDPVTYSVFNVAFEVVSAYGTVGISIGLPNVAYSFSGGWYPGSKLVLCAVMLRGRHRGLPVALDRAVRLPGDDMHKVEEEDHLIRRSMSVRRPSNDGLSGV